MSLLNNLIVKNFLKIKLKNNSYEDLIYFLMHCEPNDIKNDNMIYLLNKCIKHNLTFFLDKLLERNDYILNFKHCIQLTNGNIEIYNNTTIFQFLILNANKNIEKYIHYKIMFSNILDIDYHDKIAKTSTILMYKNYKIEIIEKLIDKNYPFFKNIIITCFLLIENTDYLYDVISLFLKKKYSLYEIHYDTDIFSVVLWFVINNYEKYIDLVELFLMHGLLETINQNNHTNIWRKLCCVKNLQILKLFIEYGLDINTSYSVHPNLLSFLLYFANDDNIIKFVISHTIIKKENLKSSMLSRNEKYRPILKRKYIKQESKKLIKNLIEII